MGNNEAKSQWGFGKEQPCRMQNFFLSPSVSENWLLWKSETFYFNLHMVLCVEIPKQESKKTVR